MTRRDFFATASFALHHRQDRHARHIVWRLVHTRHGAVNGGMFTHSTDVDPFGAATQVLVVEAGDLLGLAR